MAKFRGDRPRDRGDLALKKKRKKEKKETAAKHKGRVALLQRAGGPNKRVFKTEYLAHCAAGVGNNDNDNVATCNCQQPSSLKNRLHRCRSLKRLFTLI